MWIKCRNAVWNENNYAQSQERTDENSKEENGSTAEREKMRATAWGMIYFRRWLVEWSIGAKQLIQSRRE